MKTLIVEPNSILGELYKKLLSARGHVVRLATTGQQAIEMCDKDAPDAILLELQLNVYNGIAFLHELRSYTEWQDIPVVLNTLIHPKKIPRKIRERFGITQHLYKPSTELEIIVEYLEQAATKKQGVGA